MANIVELREKLTFGKHRGRTGAELLKSSDGTGYLVWLYKNTDVQMDMFVVDALVNAKLVSRNFQRMNSKAGGGFAKDGAGIPSSELYRDARAHELRITINQEGEGNLAEVMRKHSPTVQGLIGRSVNVQIVKPQFKTDKVEEVLRRRGPNLPPIIVTKTPECRDDPLHDQDADAMGYTIHELQAVKPYSLGIRSALEHALKKITGGNA